MWKYKVKNKPHWFVTKKAYLSGEYKKHLNKRDVAWVSKTFKEDPSLDFVQIQL